MTDNSKTIVTIKSTGTDGKEVKFELYGDDQLGITVNGEDVAGVDPWGGWIGTWSDPNKENWERMIPLGSAIGLPAGAGIGDITDVGNLVRLLLIHYNPYALYGPRKAYDGPPPVAAAWQATQRDDRLVFAAPVGHVVFADGTRAAVPGELHDNEEFAQALGSVAGMLGVELTERSELALDLDTGLAQIRLNEQS